MMYYTEMSKKNKEKKMEFGRNEENISKAVYKVVADDDMKEENEIKAALYKMF